MRNIFNRISGKIRRNFGIRVLFRLTVLISVITICFAAFFIYEQGKSLKKGSRDEGELAAQLIAQSLRLGVFSEDEALMEDIIRPYLENSKILFVTAFNAEGKALITKTKSGAPQRSLQQNKAETDQALQDLREKRAGYFHRESLGRYEVWAPVVSGLSYLHDASPLASGGGSEAGRAIGYVRVVFDKGLLNRQLSLLFMKGILVGMVFLVSVPAVFYLMIRKATSPLKKLTDSVRAVAEGSAVEPLPIETEDEIGKLALAFNDMAASLQKQEMEKQQLEGQLRQAQKMEAVGQLAGGVAHDFNNILSVIVGYGDLIRMKVGRDEQLTSHVKQILDSAQRGTTLTHSLLAFSRKQVIKVQTVKLNDIVISVEKLLMRLIGEDIEFRTRLVNRDLMIMADTGQIDQVLMNLTTNARDAMPGGGALTIGTDLVIFEEQEGFRKPGRYALLSVSDTGAGIREEDIKRIFEPFFTTKEVGKGTGLGLAMVYGIVKQHEGYIEVDSEVGKGTTFQIYFPLAEDQEAVEKRQHGDLQKRPRGSETILLAEDDERLRGLSRQILEMYGYAVIEARDGEEAIALFAGNKGKIDLLLFDLGMPKKNGLQAYEEIRKLDANVKVLFVSGYAADILHDKKILEKAVRYVSKPLLPEKLLKEVREVLDGSTPAP